jgi:hypothetical protein
MCKADNIREHYNGQTKIRDFYMKAFPTDELGKDINGNATFQDAYECLQVGFDFYTFLGVSDSIVRERVFDALATLMGCPYEHIYYQWLDHGEKPLEGRVLMDMTGLRFNNGKLEREDLTNEANKVMDTYADFDEEDSDQLLEDAMNIIKRLVDFINA